MGSSGSTSGADHRLVDRERRDVTTCTNPTHVNWVENMLHDIGTDVAAIGRDFSRLPVRLKDVDYSDPNDIYNDMVKATESERQSHETFAQREERVYKAILGIIAMSETTTDDTWNPRYYMARCGAAKLESPLNVESTVAGVISPRDELSGADRSLRDLSINNTPIVQPVDIDNLALTTDNLCQHDAEEVPTPVNTTTPTSHRSTHTGGRPRKGSVLYNPPKSSAKEIADDDQPLFDENGTELDDTNDLDGRRRQRAAVARFLSQFQQQWKLAGDEEEAAIKAAGGTPDALRGADLSKRLSKVFYQARMCKKVLLTNAQHRVLLNARFRSEVEEAEAVKDDFVVTSANPRVLRRVAAAKRKEEAAKSRLGLVGDLQANGAQKTKKMEADARVKALVDERVPPSPMIRGRAGDEIPDLQSSMCSSLPFNELSPLRENTGLPTRTFNRSANGSEAPNNDSFALGSESERIIAEGDVTGGEDDDDGHKSTNSNDYLPGSMMRESSPPPPGGATDLLVSPIVADGDDGEDSSSEDDNETSAPSSPAVDAPETATLESAFAAAANVDDEEMTDNKNKAVGNRKETLIANCRTIDVLLYFCQGIMFYPAQRMLYLLWHPWLGHLRDLGWDARIFTKDVKVDDVVPELKSVVAGGKQFSNASNASSKQPLRTQGKTTIAANGQLIKTPAVAPPPDESGLIFIRHTQALRNFISDDMMGDVPEIEISWSLEITLNKKPPGSSAVSLAFVDAHIIVHYCHIETVNGCGCCGGASNLWKARAATFAQHIYDTFQVSVRHVPSLMGMAHAMHYEAEMKLKEGTPGSLRGTIIRGTNTPAAASPKASSSSPKKAAPKQQSRKGGVSESAPLLGGGANDGDDDDDNGTFNS